MMLELLLGSAVLLEGIFYVVFRYLVPAVMPVQPLGAGVCLLAALPFALGLSWVLGRRLDL